MLAENIISDTETESFFHFKDWNFSFPNSSDYEYLANEEKLIIEYKGKRIAEFAFFLDRLHIQSDDCLLSVGIKNVSLKCKSDDFHYCFI